jgi:NMD protein affecting ribosome stability and mRNA decay
MEFCPGCGKRSKGICRDCRPLADIRYKDINIKVCASCKRTFIANKWILIRDLKQAVLKSASQKIMDQGYSLDIEMPEISMAPGSRQELALEMTKDGDKFPIIANLEITLCNLCSKGEGEYFEGELQIRNADDDVLDYIEKYCAHNNIYITKAERTKDGFDMNVTDQKKIQNLGNHLQRHFGGVLKISPKIHTKNRQTGKDVYRVNVFYELPDFKRGDALLVNGRTFLVKGVGKNVTGIDLKTGQNTTLDLKKTEYKAFKPVKTQVTRIHPHIEVLDPSTYQSVVVQNKADVKVGEKVRIIDSDGVFFIV